MDALDEVHFSYTQDYFEADWSNIVEINENVESEEELTPQTLDTEIVIEESKSSSSSIFDKIQEAKQMLDAGIINEEEFTEIKSKLIAQI